MKSRQARGKKKRSHQLSFLVSLSGAPRHLTAFQEPSIVCIHICIYMYVRIYVYLYSLYGFIVVASSCPWTTHTHTHTHQRHLDSDPSSLLKGTPLSYCYGAVLARPKISGSLLSPLRGYFPFAVRTLDTLWHTTKKKKEREKRRLNITK